MHLQPSPTSFLYNADNRLTSTTNPARSFGYDNAGNTVSDTYTATYNLAGRLATLLKAGTTSTYSVDGFGRRVRKFDSTGAASTVLFVYDQQGQLLGEYNGSGTALREYVWLGSTPIAMFVPNGSNPPLVYYIHTDHLATPRIVLNTAGQQRWSWLAEPFGTSAPNNNPQSLGAFAFFLRHPGQYADSESGLFYNYFRDYDASTGKYVQSDPIGLGGGINTYAYVEGNPLSYVDPLGLHKGDKWYGFNNREFQRWFHKCWKQAGNADADKEEIAEAYADWVSRGSPTGGAVSSLKRNTGFNESRLILDGRRLEA
ncbi:RHS repeat-associated core domain-containing protein [Piscinibacter sp.]|uniref:RHS repeat-associated core domain-containing protein n=1 Tax=Piscinibacter sp. TaxID=1903157 RepID=UPI0039E49E53